MLRQRILEDGTAQSTVPTGMARLASEVRLR